jgi:hypothetical protein
MQARASTHLIFIIFQVAIIRTQGQLTRVFRKPFMLLLLFLLLVMLLTVLLRLLLVLGIQPGTNIAL